MMTAMEVITRLLGEDFAEMVREELEGSVPPAEYTPGELTLGELGLAAVLGRTLGRWTDAIDAGMASGLRTFASIVALELEELANAVVEPWAGLFWKAARFLEDQVFEMNEGFMADVDWAAALGTAADHAARYSTEPDREAPLTAGEFWRCVAMAARELRVGLTAYKSTMLPTGLRRHENWGGFVSQVMDVCFWASRYFGCWRAPITVWDEPIPDDFDPPYSVGF